MLQKSSLPILIGFAIYCLIIFIIALVSTRRNKSLHDYVIAGRNLSGPVTALSAGASDMSSWLLMSLPGLVYIYGLSAIWMPVALVLGAYCNWRFVAKRLRVYTEITNTVTLPGYLSKRFKDDAHLLKIITGLALIIFFIFYMVSGFTAGAVIMQSIFDIKYKTALIISSTIIVTYSAIGGFLAISVIDFFQGLLMLLALLLVPIVTFTNIEFDQNLIQQVLAVKPHFFNVSFNLESMGIISLFAWGLGYFGQPHINARFMAISNINQLPIARKICMLWMVISLLGAILTGVAGFLYYINSPLTDPETTFILLSYKLFNPWILSLLLAALLSSIMSTVAAQTLMTATIISEDFYRVYLRPKGSQREYMLITKTILMIVSLFAVIISLDKTTILHSVAFAWSGLGATFGPVTLTSLYWSNMTYTGAIAGMFFGAVTVIGWQVFIFLTPSVAESLNILPGFIILPASSISLLAIWIFSVNTVGPNDKLREQYLHMQQQMH